VSVGEGLFHDVCADEDPAAHIRSMADAALRKLLAYLRGLNQQNGIAGEVWAMAGAEAWRRFEEGGRP
jgi:hypothetical protein